MPKRKNPKMQGGGGAKPKRTSKNPFNCRKILMYAACAVLSVSTLAGVTYVATGGFGSDRSSNTELSIPMHENLLEQVRAGTYDPESYIDVLVSHSPKLEILIKEKVIAGILYDPSMAELEHKIRSILEGRLDSDSLETVVASTLHAPQIKDGKVKNPTVYPTHSLVYNEGIPSYIVLPEEFVSNISISTDDDAISILEHEGATHALDQFKGIAYSNGVSLTQEDIHTKRVSTHFYNALNETRAYYNEFIKILKSREGMGPGNFGQIQFGTNAGAYFKELSLLKSYAKTPKEQQILDAQLMEHRSIIPIRIIPNTLLEFAFNLDGKGYREKTLKLSLAE